MINLQIFYRKEKKFFTYEDDQFQLCDDAVNFAHIPVISKSRTKSMDIHICIIKNLSM